MNKTLLAFALLAISAPLAAADEETVQGPGYVLAVSTAEVAVAGHPVDVTITLRPLGGYKVNDEYPLSIRVQAPDSVHVARPALTRADAKAFDHDRAVFVVPVTARSAGDKALSFAARFAVCTPSTCEPGKQTVDFRLRVK